MTATKVPATTTTVDIAAHVRTATARLSEIEQKLSDLHATEGRLAYDMLVGKTGETAQRAADVEAAIGAAERERDRLRGAIEVAGVEIAKEQEAKREQERAGLEQERQRAERVRDEHFGRVEKAVAELIGAFDDAVQADSAVRQVETALGAPHAVWVGQRASSYIAFHLSRAKISTQLPPPQFPIEVLGRPLSTRGQAAETKRQQLLVQDAEGENENG